jgi:hypothetical protein
VSGGVALVEGVLGGLREVLEDAQGDAVVDALLPRGVDERLTGLLHRR